MLLVLFGLTICDDDVHRGLRWSSFKPPERFIDKMLHSRVISLESVNDPNILKIAIFHVLLSFVSHILFLFSILLPFSIESHVQVSVRVYRSYSAFLILHLSIDKILMFITQATLVSWCYNSFLLLDIFLQFLHLISL